MEVEPCLLDIYMKVGIIGSTGGILSEVCKILAKRNYDLVLIDRNYQKSLKNKEEILKTNNINIDLLTADMSDIKSVKNVINDINKYNLDYLILGAAIYNVPLKILELGYNNVFHVNFISPYYIAREVNKKTKIIVVSSIAYNYQKIDENDIDLSNSKKQTHIYGNSKRYLTFSLMKEYQNQDKIRICHPGITLTNLTNHYPKYINWLVKIGIKLLFPSNKKAARNIVAAIDNETPYQRWIGPKLFNIFGKPKIKKLIIEENEIDYIQKQANLIYKDIKKND